MTVKYGLARFSRRGPMEYLLESGQWLLDQDLYLGAPVLLFESQPDAQSHSQQLGLSNLSCVEFVTGSDGKVLTL
jgi:hypothetical protein